MNLKKHSILLFSSCLVFALNSCGGGEKEKEAEPVEQTVDTAQEKVSDVKEDLDEATDFQFHIFIANIPSPLETMVNLSKAKMSADVSWLNATENASRYNTLTKKSLNYGVYGTDMSYLAAFDMTQDVSDYFATVKSLAEELGAADQFNKVLSDRFQANLDNHDSLIILMDNALGATDDYLKNNQRLELACLTVTGSWIESQYIMVNALMAANGKGDLEKLNESMVSQKNNLKSIVQLLGEQKDKDCKAYKTDLEGMQAAYDKLNSTADVNAANLKEIAGKLKTVREKIIK